MLEEKAGSWKRRMLEKKEKAANRRTFIDDILMLPPVDSTGCLSGSVSYKNCSAQGLMRLKTGAVTKTLVLTKTCTSHAFQNPYVKLKNILLPLGEKLSNNNTNYGHVALWFQLKKRGCSILTPRRSIFVLKLCRIAYFGRRCQTDFVLLKSEGGDLCLVHWVAAVLAWTKTPLAQWALEKPLVRGSALGRVLTMMTGSGNASSSLV